jgi:hypothetical protein
LIAIYLITSSTAEGTRVTPEEYAAEVAAELATRNADVPFDAVLRLERKTWPPGGPKITPRQTVDVWFQTGVVASMTAAEWETAADPGPMLRRVRFHVPSAAFTRFACACCRRIWDLMPGDDVRRIVEATEELLQDKISPDERDVFFDVLTESFMESLSGPSRSAADAAQELFELGFNAAFAASLYAAEARAGGTTEGPAHAAERAAQTALLRELLGNPLRNG